MEITELRVALREDSERRFKAYATLMVDRCFVVRNITIIEGKSGLFVAMPSRKPKVACGTCGFKGDAGCRYCTHCGASLPPGDDLTGAGEGTDVLVASRYHAPDHGRVSAVSSHEGAGGV